MNWLHLLRLGIVGLVFLVGWKARAVTVPLVAAYLLMLVCLPWRQRWKKRIGDLPATLACIAALLIGPLLFLAPIFFEFDELRDLLPGKAQTQAEIAAAQEWSRLHIIEPLRQLQSSLPEDMQSTLDGLDQNLMEAPIGSAAPHIRNDDRQFGPLEPALGVLCEGA